MNEKLKMKNEKYLTEWGMNEEWKMLSWVENEWKIINMSRENVIVDKSYAFAKKIVELYIILSKEHREYILSKQILRSGTSIGANIQEAQSGFSKKDFIYKVQISLKEANETHYWLRLLKDTNFILPEKANELLKDVEDIINILTAILKTSKK